MRSLHLATGNLPELNAVEPVRCAYLKLILQIVPFGRFGLN